MEWTQHFITRQGEQWERATPVIILVDLAGIVVVVVLQAPVAVAAVAGLIQMDMKEEVVGSLGLVSPMAAKVVETECILVFQLQTLLADLVAVAVQVRLIIIRQMAVVAEDIQAVVAVVE
jgi:hypothetical protein